MTAIIRNEEDIKALNVGDAYVVGVDLSRFLDDPEGPIAMLDSDEWAEVQRLERLVEEAFSSPKVDDAPAAVKATAVTVEFDATHAILHSSQTVEVAVAGDVRDGVVSFTGQQTKRRKLTDEGNGYVSVDGVEWVRP